MPRSSFVVYLGADLTGAALPLADVAGGWPEVDSVAVPPPPRDGVVIEGAIAIVITATGAAYAIARVAKYVQSNFHKPVVVDLSGAEPRVFVLPNPGGSLSGQIFVKRPDGETETLPPNDDLKSLADGIKGHLDR